MELAKKRKATMLDKSGMLVVIEVWKDNILSLRSTSKNSHIYKQMCEELKGHGVILTAVELKNRINNLSRKYRFERNAMGPSGGSPSSWDYFDILHSFLHTYKQNSVQPGERHIRSIYVYVTFCADIISIIAITNTAIIKPQEKLLELAIKENENMVTFMEHSKTTDLQIIELMKENNALMSKLVDKI
ncbi:uncharacterized protein LOC129773169 [Toxorhynchites rutilus septentrionalis]|uniref:uncharacterized protein LOC129773169 n=1 Tax=Toxorhynchites rutilus septentrionalis TaxID=329112 RepID=UPI0024783E1D|nr:uncharacterized protein LOC129773169 [Toxorhynchites rutilus septentrionalis]